MKVATSAVLAVDGLNLYQPMLELPSSSDLKSVHVCKIWTSTGKQCSGGVAIMYVTMCRCIYH